MTKEQKEKRDKLIREHEEKMQSTTVEQRREAADRVLKFFSQYSNVDVKKMKMKAVLD